MRLEFHGATGTVTGSRVLLEQGGRRLQEEEADFANRHGFSKHHPALPLYTEDDAEQVLQRFEVLDFDSEHTPWPGWRWRLRRAGHILGAASVRIGWQGGSLLLSGDLAIEERLGWPCRVPEYRDSVSL
jgi:metallo-beta-lactamase family protein